MFIQFDILVILYIIVHNIYKYLEINYIYNKTIVYIYNKNECMCHSNLETNLLMILLISIIYLLICFRLTPLFKIFTRKLCSKIFFLLTLLTNSLLVSIYTFKKISNITFAFWNNSKYLFPQYVFLYSID